MKAILEFNLPEEASEFRRATEGAEWYALCEDFDRYLEGLVKYGDNPQKVQKAFEEIRTPWYELINDRNLRLYE